MRNSREIVPHHEATTLRVAKQDAHFSPKIVQQAGASAQFAWEEFFHAEISNKYTRKNYFHAVRHFLAWCEVRELELVRIAPGDVGKYIQELPRGSHQVIALGRATPILRPDGQSSDAVVINPASTVRGERYSVIEGKTPEIKADQARTLLQSIDISTTVGLIDSGDTRRFDLHGRSGRCGRLLTIKCLTHDGTQYMLCFAEKGGNRRKSQCGTTFSPACFSNTFRQPRIPVVRSSPPQSAGRRFRPADQ